MKRIQFFSVLTVGVLLLGLSSCKKNDADFLTVAEPQAHFVGGTLQTYNITSATVAPYTVTIGTTDVSSSDRTVGFKIVSPTGAVQGTQYTVSNTSGVVTIPAGQALATFNIQGVYSQYTTGRRDTLLITLSQPSVKVAKFSDTLRLVLRGPCFEGSIVPSEFLGTYANTIEVYGTGAPYGPYTTTISAVTAGSTATTANITVTNIFDDHWNPATFTLDWTNINARKITLVQQNVGGNAGNVFGASYNGMPVLLRPAVSGAVGTFSYCNSTLKLVMNVGVQTPSGAGFDTADYTVTMSR